MAVERVIFCVLCLITCSWSQWQKGLYPPSENGFFSVFEAVQPLTVHAESTEAMVQISVSFHPRVHAQPYWEIDIKERSEVIRAPGKSWNKGDKNVSAIEIKPDAQVKDLNFHLSSNIGEIVLELKFQELKVLDGDIDIPDIGVRPLVPTVYKPLAAESACTPQYIYAKFEKTGETRINLDYGRDVHFWFEDDMGRLDNEDDLYYNHFLRKRKEYYGMEIELKEKYIRNGSEVYVRYTDRSPSDVEKYIDSILLIVHSLIEAPDPSQYVVFHDSLGMFSSYSRSVMFSDITGFRTVDCAAFGYPKPVVEVFDPNGNLMPLTEISLDTGMTTHVIASLESVPSDGIYGRYTCRARSGESVVEETLNVKENGKAKQVA